MDLKAFKALKVGDTVVVNGRMNDHTFDDERGEVVNAGPSWGESM